MKTDLLITPFNHRNIKFEIAKNKAENKIEIEKYYNEKLEQEIQNYTKLYHFEHIYVHTSNKDSFKNTKNITFYSCNIGELVNNQITNNFFYYNCFSALFLAPNNNVFAHFANTINSNAIVACPSIKSTHKTNNLDDNITTLKQSQNVYNKYFKNTSKTSKQFAFVNFNFCLINIEIAKKVQFATNYLYNDEFIIDYYYRLKTSNYSVLTALDTLIYNNYLSLNKMLYTVIEYNIANNWSKKFLHVDEYKKTYAFQFSDYLNNLKIAQLKLTPQKSIMYITTPFEWVNGMTKHVKDLIQNNHQKHIYVLSSSKNPTLENEFILNHYYNNVLINIETYNVFEFNHLSNTTSLEYDNMIEQIITTKNISLVHIHILALGHKLNLATTLKKLNVKTILSIHDLYYIGAEYTQINITNQFDESLIKDKYNLKNITQFKKNWTTQVQQLFNDVDVVIFYTTKYYEIFTKFYTIDQHKCRVIEHGSSYSKRYQLSNQNNQENIFNLVYFGRIREEKGILNLINYAKNINNIKIYIIGTKDDTKLYQEILRTKNIEYIGEYTNFEELASIIKELNIHAKIIPANWHEAFNFTLSEAIILGLYPIVYNFGALGARLNDYKIGAILTDSEPKTLSDLINKIQSQTQTNWQHELDLVNQTPVPTTQQMNDKYITLYDNLYNDQICFDTTTNKYLYRIQYNRNIKSSSLQRITLFNKIIWHRKFAFLAKSIYKLKQKFI